MNLRYMVICPSNGILHAPKFLKFQLPNQNQHHTHNKCDEVQSGTLANLKVAQGDIIMGIFHFLASNFAHPISLKYAPKM